jgi:hypothetical protein
MDSRETATRKCNGCNRRFSVTRPNRLYHSTNCRRAHNARVRRAAHRDEIGPVKPPTTEQHLKRARAGAAKKIGITPGEYERHLSNGEKWCYRCREWHPATTEYFTAYVLSSYNRASCRESDRLAAQARRDRQRAEQEAAKAERARQALLRYRTGGTAANVPGWVNPYF